MMTLLEGLLAGHKKKRRYVFSKVVIRLIKLSCGVGRY
jgi:hypothetical protein